MEQITQKLKVANQQGVGRSDLSAMFITVDDDVLIRFLVACGVYLIGWMCFAQSRELPTPN